MYVNDLDAKLRFPLLGLIFDMLAKYRLAIMQVTPNSVKFLIGFMLLYARLQLPAKSTVFRSFFQCRQVKKGLG